MPIDTKAALELMRSRLAAFLDWADEQGDTLLAVRLAEAHAIVEARAGSKDDRPR